MESAIRIDKRIFSIAPIEWWCQYYIHHGVGFLTMLAEKHIPFL